MGKLNIFFEKLTYPTKDWNPNDFGSFPSGQDKILLDLHKPNFWIGNNSCGPMDYYQQFVPRLKVIRPNETIAASRNQLKKIERDFDTHLEMDSPPECIENKKPPLYAYSWDESMVFPNGNTQPIKVLKYAFTFYKSGLPLKQHFTQKLVGLLGDSEHWHYLDMHGAVFYLLDSKNKIFSVVLAQHNHFRSYLVDIDISRDTIGNICFAIRSNEPYFCKKKQQVLATAPTFKNIRWILTGENRPIVGAWDVVPGESQRKNIPYFLNYLSSRDPLITSWRELGPNIKIWGLFSSFYRNSPPGMAIFNIPYLKPIWKTAMYFYFDPKDDQVLEHHEETFSGYFEFNGYEVFKANSKRFGQKYLSKNL